MICKYCNRKTLKPYTYGNITNYTYDYNHKVYTCNICNVRYWAYRGTINDITLHNYSPYHFRLDLRNNKSEIRKSTISTITYSNKKFMQFMRNSSNVNSFPYIIYVTPQNLTNKIKTILLFS